MVNPESCDFSALMLSFKSRMDATACPVSTLKIVTVSSAMICLYCIVQLPPLQFSVTVFAPSTASNSSTGGENSMYVTSPA